MPQQNGGRQVMGCITYGAVISLLFLTFSVLVLAFGQSSGGQQELTWSEFKHLAESEALERDSVNVNGAGTKVTATVKETSAFFPRRTVYVNVIDKQDYWFKDLIDAKVEFKIVEESHWPVILVQLLPVIGIIWFIARQTRGTGKGCVISGVVVSLLYLAFVLLVSVLGPSSDGPQELTWSQFKSLAELKALEGDSVTVNRSGTKVTAAVEETSPSFPGKTVYVNVMDKQDYWVKDLTDAKVDFKKVGELHWPVILVQSLLVIGFIWFIARQMRGTGKGCITYGAVISLLFLTFSALVSVLGPSSGGQQELTWSQFKSLAESRALEYSSVTVNGSGTKVTAAVKETSPSFPGKTVYVIVMDKQDYWVKDLTDAKVNFKAHESYRPSIFVQLSESMVIIGFMGLIWFIARRTPCASCASTPSDD
jgi:uncharacterized protein YneR